MRKTRGSKGVVKVDVSGNDVDNSKTTSVKKKPSAMLSVMPKACEIEAVELQDLVADYCKVYGEYVVGNRAVPDFRDGLKPVFRAALWAMNVNGMRPGTPHKKSARTVGNIIGKYHPHGDKSAYDAMVTIANGVMPNLIDGKGNWGSHVDDAAAYRYCFVGNTRLMTNKGLVKIADLPFLYDESLPSDILEIDKKKVEFDGSIFASSLDNKMAVSHWINSGYQQIMGVKTNLGNTIKCTPNQPVYVLDGLDYVWRNVSDLKLGDCVCIKLENKVDVEGRQEIPDFDYTELTSNSTIYDQTSFPRKMTKEFAFLLGALVAEGSSRKGHGVQFNNTNRRYYDKFVASWKSCFGPDVEYSETLNQPRSYGKKRFKTFNAKYTIIGRWFEHVGIQWGSYNQVVPEIIFRSSREEVASFLQGLFEGDGSVTNIVALHSRSKKLLKHVQQLLLSYFGVYSTFHGNYKLSVSGSENILNFAEHLKFVSKSKQQKLQDLVDNALNTLNENNCGGGYELNNIPNKTIEEIKREFDKFRTSSKKFISEDGKDITIHGSRFVLSDDFGCTRLFSRIPTNIRKLRKHLEIHSESARKYWPKLVSRIENLSRADYFYARVDKIVSAGKEWVYDITVPETHAFTANGIISHNTEARLSKFAETFLLDKNYLSVVPYVDNFDGTEKWPLFLPATLPIQLIIGSSGIAYGVAASTPSFRLKGVAKLVELALRGKVITPRLCLKYLEVHNRYGGNCISPEKDFLQLYETGKGSLRFVADIVAPDDCKTLKIESCAPGFANQNSIDNTLEKIAKLPGVASVSDQCGRDAGKYGIRYTVKLKRLNEDAYNETYDKVEKLVSGSESYHIGYTHRKPDSARFGRMSVCDFIHNWVKYRIGLEKAVIKHLVSVEQKNLEKEKLLLWGTDHIDDIAAALKDRKIGPKAYLLKVWPSKDEEFVSELLKRQIQQIAHLERKTLLDNMKKIEASIASLKADFKEPGVRILRTFGTQVSDYIKYAAKNGDKENLGI